MEQKRETPLIFDGKRYKRGHEAPDGRKMKPVMVVGRETPTDVERDVDEEDVCLFIRS